eukprot:scaffold208776_cov41-Prasinocladus_malaysianus.AAC.2
MFGPGKKTGGQSLLQRRGSTAGQSSRDRKDIGETGGKCHLVAGRNKVSDSQLTPPLSGFEKIRTVRVITTSRARLRRWSRAFARGYYLFDGDR